MKLRSCEYCSKEHLGTFASGRFCSRSCSRGYSTRAKRADISIRAGLKQKGKVVSEETREKLRAVWKDPLRRVGMGRKTKVGEVTKTGFLKGRLMLCEECGADDYHNGKPLVLQLHHVDGNRKNNRVENLQLLCPNCHSQTHNFAGRGRRFTKPPKKALSVPT